MAFSPSIDLILASIESQLKETKVRVSVSRYLQPILKLRSVSTFTAYSPHRCSLTLSFSILIFERLLLNSHTHPLLSLIGLRRITLPPESATLNLLSPRYSNGFNRRSFSESRFDRSCTLLPQRSCHRSSSSIRLWYKDHGDRIEGSERIGEEESLYCYGWKTENARRYVPFSR